MTQEPASLSLKLTHTGDRTENGSRSPTRDEMTLPSKLATFASRAAMALAVALLLASMGLYVLRSAYAGKIYPCVYVASIDLSGLSHSEAQVRLQSEVHSILAISMSLEDGPNRWTPTFADLGVKVDDIGSIDTAYGVGREGDAGARVRSTLNLVNDIHSVPLKFIIDERQFDAWFDQVDSDLGAPPRDAALRIDGDAVNLIPEVDGRVGDRDRVHALLVSSLQTLQPFTGALPITVQTASLRGADLETERTRLAVALSQPIELRYGKRTWSVRPGDISEYVRQEVARDPTGAARISFVFDEVGLAAYFGSILRDEIDRDPVNARVGWDIDNQKPFTIEQSRNGARLEVEELAKAVAASFWDDAKVITIPTIKIKPEVDSTNLNALGITTRLSVGDSNFDGSDYGRSANIAVGAALLNGTLVPPGGEFSFNHAIGEITESKGYVEAGVVDGERIGKDIGGGICQVSTTVFRSVFYAGLPITEWNPHRYRLGFYEQDGWEPGLDASILQPEADPFGGGDFRFSNPSDSWLLIESYADNARVYVIIYGPDLGYTVDVAGPRFDSTEYPPTGDIEIVDLELPPGTVRQTEYELSGMDVFYQRTVYDRDGNLLWDRTFGTHFYPRGNAFKVSPDMKGESPAAHSKD